MKKKIVFSGVICLAVIFMLSVASNAASIKTKIFYKDLEKCQKFIDKQHKLLMEFLATLTEEDVAAINTAKSTIEIFNGKAIKLLKELKKMGNYPPKNIKGWPHSKFGSNLIGSRGKVNVVSNYASIMKYYSIPEEDYKEALDKYTDYIVGLLDKIQELRDKVQSVGLEINRFPEINRNSVLLGQQIFLYNSDNYSKSRGPGLISLHRVYTDWIRSTKELLELYSNQNVLLAQKLWLEFLLINDFTIDGNGDSREEKYMTELDKIEKRLAKLSGAQEQKEKPTEKAAVTKSDEPSAPTQKTKFKLDLPK